MTPNTSLSIMQRRGDQRAQSAARRAARERELHRLDVGFVHQLAAQAAAAGRFRPPRSARCSTTPISCAERRAAFAHAVHDEQRAARTGRRRCRRNRCRDSSSRLRSTTSNTLRSFLVNADGMRGAIQQLHALELHLELALGDHEILDVGVRAEPLEDAARRVAQWHRARLEPAIHAVEAANAEAQVDRCRRSPRRAPTPSAP